MHLNKMYFIFLCSAAKIQKEVRIELLHKHGLGILLYCKFCSKLPKPRLCWSKCKVQ